MGMQAVGTYIRTLRDQRGMTANDLAFATGLNVTYIWRVESGETKDPGLDRISKIIDVLKGRGDHIVALFLQPDASDEYIQALVKEARLSAEEREKAETFMVTDEETRDLLEVVYEKAANPALRGRIRGYIDALGDDTNGGGAEPPPSPKPKRTLHRRRA